MKKILLGLFVLSSLSFATTSTDKDGKVTAIVPINVNAIVSGENNNLALEITDTNNVVKNSLDFMHTLKPTEGSSYTEKFKVRLKNMDENSDAGIFLNPTTNLTFTEVAELIIAESKSTEQSPIKISTTFSPVSHDGENFALTNFIATPSQETPYTIGSYTGSKADGLTITFNKTNTPLIPIGPSTPITPPTE